MSRLRRFLLSAIGAKATMALTGLLLGGFVIGHLSGNLIAFAGRDAFNDYAETLKGLGPLLWAARAALLAVFIVHVATGIRLARIDRAARPVGYVRNATVQASVASRTMLISGLLVLAFVVVHLLHFTIGVIDADAFARTESLTREGAVIERHDAFSMLVLGFRNDLLVVVYLVSMIVLGLHLSHALHSAVQTFGLHHSAWSATVRRVLVVAAWAIVAGFATIPLAVRAGLIGTEVQA